MKSGKIQRDGFNKRAAIFGPFWYIYRGMLVKGIIYLLTCAITLGLAVIPVWIYCACRGNRDFYYHLKNKGIYIY